MNALLSAVVSFLETVATYSVGATLVTLGVVVIICGARSLLNERDGRRYSRRARLVRRGTGSLALVGVLSVGLTAVLAGLLFWSR